MRELQVVYGGQWGSEGKGQVCAYLAREEQEMDGKRELIAVRVGGPNAGHTITDYSGVERKLQQIPCAVFAVPYAMGAIGPAGLILPHVFLRELDWLRHLDGRRTTRLIIDPNAIVIEPKHMEEEAHLKGAIGSTGEGVGAATAAKAMRTGILFWDWLEQYADVDTQRLVGQMCLKETVPDLINNPTGDRLVQLEGTQGYWLSLNASGYYPFCTSRDCGPEAIMGQVNTNPRAYDGHRIICVMRTYPIRVGGNSGDLPNEVDWDWMRAHTGGYIQTPEVTTVTLKARRIAQIDPALSRRMLMQTRPTSVALTFLDYDEPQAFHEWEEGKHPDDVLYRNEALQDRLRTYQALLGPYARIELASFGPGAIARVDPAYLEVR